MLQGKLVRSFIILLLSFPVCHAHAQHVLNIKDFGATGDGTTDDYNAFRSLADSVNKLGSAEITFPEGNYFIGEYHTKDHSLKDIIFSNCDGITINGYKAVISVNGSFNRPGDRFNGKHFYSKTNAITPFRFDSCTNIIINGIEINGNVDKMTRDKNVAEFGTHLITLMQCRNVQINDVHLHHSQTDGVYIRGNNSYNINISNSIFSNNSRQGMSIIGLDKGYFLNCQFINTGITEGSYGRDNPSDGVDIESGSMIRGLTFDHCSFINNQGGQFICSSASKVSDIQLKHCRIDAGSSKRPSQVLFYANKVLVDSSYIDCGTGSLYATWKLGYACTVEIKNSTVKSSAHGIIAVVNDMCTSGSLSVHDDSLYCTADTIKTYFPYLKMPHLVFIDNTILFSASSIQTNYDCNVSSIEGEGYYLNNEFRFLNNKIIPEVYHSGLKTVWDVKLRPN